MGGDCCGGGTPADAAAAEVAQMTMKSAANGKDTEEKAPPRPWEEIVAEKKQYYQQRIDLFTQYKERHVAAIDAAKAANVPIKIILPDGSEKAGVKGVTTPMDVANQISKSLAKKTVVAKVDGQVWDMLRPLEGDCALQLLNFDDPDGKEVGRAHLYMRLSLICLRLVLVLQIPPPLAVLCIADLLALQRASSGPSPGA
jgi:hypothetical protein